MDILYQTMLNRQADEGGKAGWVDALNKGYTFQDIINGFCGSSEFNALCEDYGITAGSVNTAMTAALAAAIKARELPDVRIGTAMSTDETGTATVNGYEAEEIKAFVEHSYRETLGREADPAAVDSLTEQMVTGQALPKDALQMLMDSEEMKNRDLNNEEYVSMLYKTYLQRDTDELAGLWVSALESGISRETLVKSFENSTEFRVVLARFGL